MQEFSLATTLLCGADALDALNALPAERVLVVADPFFVQNGTAARLAARFSGAQTQIFSEICPDPEVQTVAKGAELLRAFVPDTLVALGGGSALDCAKAILAMSGAQARLIAVPTSSGTGSEVTRFAVLTHEGKKHPLIDPALRPQLALLDETLLTSLPPSVLCDAGFDAVSHALEALCAARATPFSDAFALCALQTLLRELPRSFGGERTARAAVHCASTMAGVAFDNAGLGLCHALSHALGGAFHIPHGRLNAVLLEHVVRAQAEKCDEIYRRAAAFCGLSGTQGLLFALRRLRARLRLPESLRGCGISGAELLDVRETLLDAALADPCALDAPVAATREVFSALLEAAK